MAPRPDRDLAHRAARRRVAARHHPDRGGSTESFIAAMAELERRHCTGDPDGHAPRMVVRSPVRTWLRTTIGRLARRRTRYIDL